VCTFVRFFGCPVKCEYCDTPESWKEDTLFKKEFPSFEEKTIEEILKTILELGNRNVIITGGEPVIQPDFEKFLIALNKEPKITNIVIETSGIPIPFELNKRDEHSPRVSWAVDYKLPSAKSNYPYLNLFKYEELSLLDFVKFLIFTKKDLTEALQKCKEIKAKNSLPPNFVFTPGDPVLINDILATAKEEGVEIIINVQIHKVLGIE
jgi:7-carboxy-7-deazaguanine synthase